MVIKPAISEDLEKVSAICMAAFIDSVVETLPAEGLSTFTQIASAEAFATRLKEDNVILVAEDNGQIHGVAELKAGHHVAMLFIDPKCQRKGIGQLLLDNILQQARINEVTVRASLTSVPFYQKNGFTCSDDIGEIAGLVYQPMVRKVSSENQSQSKNQN